MLLAKKRSKFTRKYDWLDEEESLNADEKVLSAEQQEWVASVYPACWELAYKVTPRVLRNDPDNVEKSYELALKAVYRCAHKFDKSYGVKFITYAYGSMNLAIWSYWSQVKKKTGKIPKVVQFYDDNSYKPCGGENLLEVFVSDKRYEREQELAEFRIDMDRLDKLLECLGKSNPRWRKIVEMRLGIDGRQPMTLQEVAEIEGCCKERIRQVVNASIKMMKIKAKVLGMTE